MLKVGILFGGILTNEGIDWLAPACGGKTVMYWKKVKSWQISAAGLQRVTTTNHSPFTPRAHLI